MRMYAVVLVAVMLVLGAVSAWAYPTLSGATGLVTLPTADVVPTGAVDLAIDYQQDLGNMSGLYGMDSDIEILPIRAAIGIAPKCEVSLGYTAVKENDWDDGKLWNIGGKYMLLSEAMGDDFSMAVGGSIGELDNSISLDVTNVYLALSKDFSTAMGEDQSVSIVGHAGVTYLEVEDMDLTEPFIGVEIADAKGASLVLEYRFEDTGVDDDAPFSAALRLPLSKESPLWLQIGTTNAGMMGVGADDSELFFGIGYRIGGMLGIEETGARDRSWGY